MTRPTARVLALLEILQTGGTRTVADLAGRLEVDERTVRRYVQHLLDLDVPVESVRGRYGGYRLAPGYRMPPLMLTDEEALAVLLGLLVGRRDGLVAVAAAAVESAAAKVRRVLPKALGARVAAVLETAEFTEGSEHGVAPETAVLLLLAEAVRDRRPVAIGYTARNGRSTDRELRPYGIVAHSGRWYVTGADSASGEVRSFRLDRITRAEAVAGSFDVPEGFDPATQLLDGIARGRRRFEVVVRVQGAPDAALAAFPRNIATVDDLGEGWSRVTLRAERLDWVPGVLVATALPFVVEGPDELRDLLRGTAERLLAAVEPLSGPGSVRRPVLS